MLYICDAEPFGQQVAALGISRTDSPFGEFLHSVNDKLQNILRNSIATTEIKAKDQIEWHADSVGICKELREATRSGKIETWQNLWLVPRDRRISHLSPEDLESLIRMIYRTTFSVDADRSLRGPVLRVCIVDGLVDWPVGDVHDTALCIMRAISERFSLRSMHVIFILNPDQWKMERSAWDRIDGEQVCGQNPPP